MPVVMAADNGTAPGAMSPQEAPALALGLPTRPSALFPPTRSAEPWTEEQWFFRFSNSLAYAEAALGGLGGAGYFKYQPTELKRSQPLSPGIGWSPIPNDGYGSGLEYSFDVGL